MHLLHQRYLSKHNYTAAVLTNFAKSRVLSYLLEDAVRAVKIKKETCIPPGEYEIVLRHEGRLAEHYDKKFQSFGHDGMLWITNVPNYEWVYYHIGNDIDDTEGCPLVGNRIGYTGVLSQSTIAYERIYRLIYPAAKARDCHLLITEKF